MKLSAFTLLVCLAAAWAQTAPPAAETQQERLKRQAAEAASASQTPAATPNKLSDLPDDAVIAVSDDGAKFTMGDFKRIAAISAQSKQLALTDPAGAVRFWAGMRRLEGLAVADKLDQISPTKEQLAFDRTMILGQAMMNSKLNTIEIDPADMAKYYETNKEQFKSVRVKALYIVFGDAPGAKASRTEAQAKAMATRLLAQIRAGADFVKLVKENSDDQTSRDKDGDFGTYHRTENIPDAIKNAVFALKKGEVSEPIPQPHGYYLLRAEEVSYAPEAQVQTDILLTLRQQRYNEWLNQNTAGVKVQFPNPAFPGTPAAPPAAK